MSDKIKTCKSPFIDEGDFQYTIDIDGFSYTMQVLSFRQRAKTMKGLGEKTQVNQDGEAVITTDMSAYLLHILDTVKVALISWTLPRPLTSENVELLSQSTVNALYQAIHKHEDKISSAMAGDEKNS